MMGGIAALASDGKRDYSWGRNQATEHWNGIFEFPADEKRFGDFWYKSFLEAYDKKK